MALKLETIDFEKYFNEREQVQSLAKSIWTRPESYENIIHSIERWANNKESGNYFYILHDGQKIGLTGYWPIRNDVGSFGLRHHGTTVTGTGQQALNLLVQYLHENSDSFKQLIELIPKDKEELIPIFENWGFTLDPNGVPDWEPKKDYYKYAMIKKLD